MIFNPRIHHRHSIRLARYDYSTPGSYFVTICVQDRRRVLGEIVGSRVALNAKGKIVRDVIVNIPSHYKTIAIDSFVIMTDHVHVVITIKHRHQRLVNVTVDDGRVVDVDGRLVDVEVGLRPAPATPAKHFPPLSEIVRAIKSFSSREINQSCFVTPKFVWQRNYYERIIDSNDALYRVRKYIQNNPSRAFLDQSIDENNQQSSYRIHK